jgi:hypothetical protein
MSVDTKLDAQVDAHVTAVTNLTKFTRWSGPVAMLGGLLVAIGIPLHPLRYGEAVKQSPYAAIHTLISVGLMLALFGLVGLYVRQADKLGRLGLIGFFVAFIGQVLTLSALMTEGFMWPAVAQYDPAAVHNFDATSPVRDVVMLLAPALFGGLVLFAVGYALFGIATVRAAVPARWGGVLIAIGAVLYAVGGFTLPLLGAHSIVVTIIESSGAIPFGLGFILIGYTLWTGRNSVTNARAA